MVEKRKINIEKGSISIYAIATVFCFIIILGGIFISNSAIRRNQLKTLLKIKEVYGNRADKLDLLPADGSYSSEKGVNTPNLAENMTPIKWDEASSKWIRTISGDSEWYDYNTTEPKWANAVLNGIFNDNGELDESAEGYSMFVWIPRFAYQIEDSYHEGGEDISGTINIKFMQGTSNIAADETTAWSNKSGEGEWNIHPAFSYNGTVAGIWVAKFEASHEGCTTDASTGATGEEASTLKLQVKAGVTSWRNITVSDAYDVCLNYETASNSHLMKNSEWGAVVYLAQSLYGKNSEVWINNSSSYITGSAGSTASAEADVGTTNAYTSEQGMEASTTGNVYGIYDMSGGSWEYVAAYVNNENGRLTTYASSLVSGASYTKDVYSVGTSDTQDDNYAVAISNYGDAVYETSSSGTGSTSWYYDYSSFPATSTPVFIRGAAYLRTVNTGVFSSSKNAGNADAGGGFRPVLVVPSSEEEPEVLLADGSYSSTKGVNTPNLEDELTPIKWDEASSKWVKTVASDSTWYDYSSTEKKWANAVLNGTFNANGELDESVEGYSMFVWIPRFAYQIVNNYHSGGDGVNGIINIKFMQGTSDTAADGTSLWDNTSGEGNWNVHTAFLYDVTVPGIWVAKFEASHKGCTTDASTGVTGEDVNTLTLQVKAGVTSWRNITVSDAYDVCLNYKTSLNSHLIKNTEWGAVAYLAQSSYGKNSEIWVNNSSSYITGSAGNSVSAAGDVETTNDYASEQGVEASTTGNVYGIYDMSGGSWERVAAYVNNGTTTTYGTSLVNGEDYTKDVYSVGTSDTAANNCIAAISIYGDAIYETTSGGYGVYGWNYDYANYPSGSEPFFSRGGYSTSATHAGTYSFAFNAGANTPGTSFRPVLATP